MTDCTHHFEHVKQTRPFTEREYMQCTKCGLQNPLGLFQSIDFDQPGGVPVRASLSDNTRPGRNVNKGRSSGPHLQWSLSNATHRKLYPKAPRTRVYQTRHKYWRFACNKCPQGAESPDWKLMQKLADHHARNHHRSTDT